MDRDKFRALCKLYSLHIGSPSIHDDLLKHLDRGIVQMLNGAIELNEKKLTNYENKMGSVFRIYEERTKDKLVELRKFLKVVEERIETYD